MCAITAVPENRKEVWLNTQRLLNQTRLVGNGLCVASLLWKNMDKNRRRKKWPNKVNMKIILRLISVNSFVPQLHT